MRTPYSARVATRACARTPKLKHGKLAISGCLRTQIAAVDYYAIDSRDTEFQIRFALKHSMKPPGQSRRVHTAAHTSNRQVSRVHTRVRSEAISHRRIADACRQRGQRGAFKADPDDLRPPEIWKGADAVRRDFERFGGVRYFLKCVGDRGQALPRNG